LVRRVEYSLPWPRLAGRKAQETDEGKTRWRQCVATAPRSALLELGCCGPWRMRLDFVLAGRSEKRRQQRVDWRAGSTAARQGTGLAPPKRPRQCSGQPNSAATSQRQTIRAPSPERTAFGISATGCPAAQGLPSRSHSRFQGAKKGGGEVTLWQEEAC